MALIAGIDEAGRGPVIGPLAIAIAALDEESEPELRKMGVRDSKLLSPGRREALSEKIKALCRHEVLLIEPKEIDAAVLSDKTNLNWLEADKAAILINKFKPDKVFVDCPSNNVADYTAYLKSKLDYSPELVVEHKADVTYSITSAASILAKVGRDDQIRRLKERFVVDFGSGYPSDPVTMDFVKKNFNKYPFFRKSWQTWRDAADACNQSSLSGLVGSGLRNPE